MSSSLSLEPEVENALLSLLEVLDGPMETIFLTCVLPGLSCVMEPPCMYIYLYKHTHTYM